VNATVRAPVRFLVPTDSLACRCGGGEDPRTCMVADFPRLSKNGEIWFEKPIATLIF
jgi:hypothetical protein